MRNCCKYNPVYQLYNGQKLCRKHFLEYMERKVKKTVSSYSLIGKREKLLLASSGGKDSTTALYLLNRLNKNPKVKIEAFHVDVGIGNYSKQNLRNVRKFCKKQGIRLHETSFRKEFGYSLCYIRSALKGKGVNQKTCTVCGTLRRYLINLKAREIKATKVVTGHNLDDEAQSVIMNIFKNNLEVMRRLGPITGVVRDRKFVPRVKPLYFCSEQETKLYSQLNRFKVQYKRCPCSAGAYRRQVAKMLDQFDQKHPGTKHSVINSFLEILPSIKKEAKGELRYCQSCGEPSNKRICNVCSIVKKLKPKG